MPTKTFFSRHIKKIDVKDTNGNSASSVLDSNILLFNQVKFKAFSLDNFGEPSPPKDSIHCTLKKEFNLNDYFVNSAHNEARAARKSALECLQRIVSEKESQIEQMDSKLKKIDKDISRLTDIKFQLVKISKSVKEGKKLKRLSFPKRASEYYNEDGLITVGRRKPKTFKDNYSFETGYVTPQLKALKHRRNVILKRQLRTKRELNEFQALLNKKHPSVCFGSKKYFHRQFFGDMNHSDWKKKFTRIRHQRMTISGRSDATQGNFVFHYDTDKNILYYKAMDGKTVLSLPCVFPYGQEDIDNAVNAIPKKKFDEIPENIRKEQNLWYRKAICWSIEDWGNSYIVKCMVNVPEPDKNYFYDNGDIGIDMNADNISFSETDKNGNLIYHQVIEFDILGKSSEQTEHILSEALEVVFKHAEKKNKPISMEDISDIKQKSLYRGKRLNQVLSSFAYSKMQALAESKSNKYKIRVKKVNPTFTSQMGKTKYMRKYGLSVHESAAFVIARRGMGLNEKLPTELLPRIPKSKINKHHWSHWRHLQKEISQIDWRSVYEKPVASQLKPIKEKTKSSQSKKTSNKSVSPAASAAT